MSNTKPDTPIWVLCTTLGDITDGQVNVKVHHHGANFYAHLQDCKLGDPSDMLPSPVTEAKKVRYKRNKMKVGDKVWVLCEVTEMTSESVKVNSGHGKTLWVYAKQCKPVEPEAVDQPKLKAIFKVKGHDRRGTVGTITKTKGWLSLFESTDGKFLRWCYDSDFDLLDDFGKRINKSEPEAVEQANTIKFKVGDPVITWGGRKGVVTDIDTASEYPIRVMLNPFSFVNCRTDQVTRGTPEIDSSMRQLNWNEVIQDGDVLVTINDRYAGYKQPLTIYAVDSIGKRVDDAFSKGKKLGLTKLFYRRIEKGTK